LDGFREINRNAKGSGNEERQTDGSEEQEARSREQGARSKKREAGVKG